MHKATEIQFELNVFVDSVGAFMFVYVQAASPAIMEMTPTTAMENNDDDDGK